MKQKLILLLSTILFIFTFTEIFLTFLVETDLDGNMSLNYIHLKPYQLPVIETQNKINTLLENKLPDSLIQNYFDKSFKRKYFQVRLVPDSILGWSPNPYYKSNNGLYIYNKDGIRTDNILANFAHKKKLRIAIFGDSYAHGDEVNFRSTIGYFLETELKKVKVNSEVLNFAVSGYGMDQAYLRYKMVKDKYKPDIIILGVQFENVKRHINLLRPFYYFTTEIPYSKPRYIIQANKLQLIPNPINDIKHTADIIKNFDDWYFLRFEGFYIQQNYYPSFIYSSKTISFVESAISQIFSEIDYYEPNSESYKITYKIFDEFKKSVNKDDKLFIPVHLPVKNDFDYLTKNFIKLNYNQQFIYDDLFNALKLINKFVEPYHDMTDWSNQHTINGLFEQRHYSANSNKIIAHDIFKYISNVQPTLFYKIER